jgi:hypothetical protein
VLMGLTDSIVWESNLNRRPKMVAAVIWFPASLTLSHDVFTYDRLQCRGQLALNEPRAALKSPSEHIERCGL